jgi:type II secretory pathway pseudopilin PulG
MKTQHTHNKRDYKYKGFTLVETAIAMGMVAVMISSFLVVFGPAIKGIDKSLSAKAADRLTDALELELSVLRLEEENEAGNEYNNVFEKAFEWIGDSFNGSSTNRDDIVLVYQYRGNPDRVNSDGTLAPYTLAMAQAYEAVNNEPPVAGVQYIIQPIVRRFANPLVEDELEGGTLEGKIYYVRMAQLYRENRDNSADGSEEMVLTDDRTIPVEIRDPYNPANIKTVDDYPDAVLVYQAQFYEFKPALYDAIRNFNPSILTGATSDPLVERNPVSLGKPILTKNMVVVR